MELSRTIETETGEMIVKRVCVPLGLEELMEGLAKEVILKKPKDIYIFAADYFSRLLKLRDSGLYRGNVRSAKLAVKRPFKATVMGQNILSNSDSKDSETNKGRKTPYPRRPTKNPNESTEERRAMIRNHLRKKQEMEAQKKQIVNQPSEKTKIRSKLPTRSSSLSGGSAGKNQDESNRGGSQKNDKKKLGLKNENITKKIISPRSRSTSVGYLSRAKEPRSKKQVSLSEKDPSFCGTESLNKISQIKVSPGNAEATESDKSISVTQDKNGHYEVFYHPMPLPVDDGVASEQPKHIADTVNEKFIDRAENLMMTKSVTTIQAFWRGRKQRQLFRERLEKNIQTVESNENTEMKKNAGEIELSESSIQSAKKQSNEESPASPQNIFESNGNSSQTETTRTSIVSGKHFDAQKDSQNAGEFPPPQEEIHENPSKVEAVINPVNGKDSSTQEINQLSSKEELKGHRENEKDLQTDHENSEAIPKEETEDFRNDVDEHENENEIVKEVVENKAELNETKSEEVPNNHCDGKEDQSTENANHDNKNVSESDTEQTKETGPPIARPRRSISQKKESVTSDLNNLNDDEEKNNNIEYHRSQTLEISGGLSKVLDDETESSDRETLNDVNSLAFQEENSFNPSVEGDIAPINNIEEINETTLSDLENSDAIMLDKPAGNNDIETFQEKNTNDEVSLKTEYPKNEINQGSYEDIDKTDNEMKSTDHSDKKPEEKMMKYKLNKSTSDDAHHSDEFEGKKEATLRKTQSNEEGSSQRKRRVSVSLNANAGTSIEMIDSSEVDKESNDKVSEEETLDNSEIKKDVKKDNDLIEQPNQVNTENEGEVKNNDTKEKFEKESDVGEYININSQKYNNVGVEKFDEDLTSENVKSESVVENEISVNQSSLTHHNKLGETNSSNGNETDRIINQGENEDKGDKSGITQNSSDDKHTDQPEQEEMKKNELNENTGEYSVNTEEDKNYSYDSPKYVIESNLMNNPQESQIRNNVSQDENYPTDEKVDNIQEDDENSAKGVLEANSDIIVEPDTKAHSEDDEFKEIGNNISQIKFISPNQDGNIKEAKQIDNKEETTSELKGAEKLDTEKETSTKELKENGIKNKINEKKSQNNDEKLPQTNNTGDDQSYIENIVSTNNEVSGNEEMQFTDEDGAENNDNYRIDTNKIENISKESDFNPDFYKQEVTKKGDIETKDDSEKDESKEINQNPEELKTNKDYSLDLVDKKTSEIITQGIESIENEMCNANMVENGMRKDEDSEITKKEKEEKNIESVNINSSEVSNEGESALKIQTIWRGFQARKHLKKLLEEKTDTSKNHSMLNKKLSMESVKDENENLPETKNKNISQNNVENITSYESAVEERDGKNSIDTGIQQQNVANFTDDEIQAAKKIQYAYRKSKITQGKKKPLEHNKKDHSNGGKVAEKISEKEPDMLKKNWNALGHSRNSKEHENERSYSAEEIRAVIKIQLFFRNFKKHRDEALKNRQENKEKRLEIDNEGSSSRTNSPSEFEDLLSKNPDSFSADEIQAATKIQSTFRRMRKKNMKPKPEDLDLDSDMGREYLREILKIQSAWRAYRVKKNIRDVEEKITTIENMSGTPSKKSIHLTDQEILKAVTKIQAGLRGYLTRKHYNNVREKNEAMDKIKEESGSDYSRMNSTGSNDEKLLEILKQVDGLTVPDTLPDIPSADTSVKSDNNHEEEKSSPSEENRMEDIKKEELTSGLEAQLHISFQDSSNSKDDSSFSTSPQERNDEGHKRKIEENVLLNNETSERGPVYVSIPLEHLTDKKSHDTSNNSEMRKMKQEENKDENIKVLDRKEGKMSEDVADGSHSQSEDAKIGNPKKDSENIKGEDNPEINSNSAYIEDNYEPDEQNHEKIVNSESPNGIFIDKHEENSDNSSLRGKLKKSKAIDNLAELAEKFDSDRESTDEEEKTITKSNSDPAISSNPDEKIASFEIPGEFEMDGGEKGRVQSANIVILKKYSEDMQDTEPLEHIHDNPSESATKNNFNQKSTAKISSEKQEEKLEYLPEKIHKNDNEERDYNNENDVNKRSTEEKNETVSTNSYEKSSSEVSLQNNRPTLTDFMKKTLGIGSEETDTNNPKQERIKEKTEETEKFVPVRSRYESATKIQSLFRGYRARRYVERLKASSALTKAQNGALKNVDVITPAEKQEDFKRKAVTSVGDGNENINSSNDSQIPPTHTQDIAVGPNGNVDSGGTQENVPAGVEILTTEAHHATDVGEASGDVESHAQPSNEDENTQDALSRKSEFESEREMESTKRNNSTLRNKNMEVEAATKIQAGFRGYKVRKQLKMMDPSSEEPTKKTVRRKSSSCLTENQAKKQKENIDLQEKSAVKIQAGIRGFLVRKKVKRPQKSEE